MAHSAGMLKEIYDAIVGTARVAGMRDRVERHSEQLAAIHAEDLPKRLTAAEASITRIESQSSAGSARIWQWGLAGVQAVMAALTVWWAHR